MKRSSIGQRYVLLVLLWCFLSQTAPAQSRVVGYYPSWQRYDLPAPAVMFQHLTHVNQAFAWPLADGSIAGYSDLLYPELISAAHQAGRKVLIALGGWGNSDGFAPMAADSVTRARFVQNLIAYMETNGFDGADIDWETPGNSSERGSLLSLVKEIRAGFDAEGAGWLLTMAIPQSAWGGGNFDYSGMLPYLDWYNVMTYDTHGSWSAHAGHNCPLYAPTFDADGSIDQSVRYLNGPGAFPSRSLSSESHSTGRSSRLIHCTVLTRVARTYCTRRYPTASRRVGRATGIPHPTFPTSQCPPPTGRCAMMTRSRRATNVHMHWQVVSAA